jgi:hypothetical protein
MKKLLLIIITLHLSVFDAVAESNLYSGEVAVASQSGVDRKKAMPDALVQVMQKLSGLREIPLSPELDTALTGADRMLRSYRYSNIEKTGPDGMITEELRLVAEFIPSEVDRVVKQAGLPRWQQQRPAVQIWVVVEDAFNRKLKPLEFEYAWESVTDVATLRGLPVSWPDLDEEQIQLIDMSLLWGGFTDYLVERGAPADGVAIIAVRREGPNWTLRWNVANDVQNWSWRNSDQELMFALTEGVHRMADQIAASNSILASDQGLSTVDVTIGGLINSSAYIDCLNYLQSVNLITAIEILGADLGRVHFRLQLNASPEFLDEAFNRGSALSRSRVGSEYDYVFIQ